jgi:hypothetical protein
MADPDFSKMSDDELKAFIASAQVAPAAAPAPDLPAVGPYDFGQRVSGRSLNNAPAHLVETPGFAQSVLAGKNYADPQPEVQTRRVQNYALPAEAKTPDFSKMSDADLKAFIAQAQQPTSAQTPAGEYADVPVLGPDGVQTGTERVGKMLKGAVQNILPSTGELIKNIVQPIIHPIDTATGLYQVGKGVASKLGLVNNDPKAKEENERVINALGQHLVERYGGVENVMNTFEKDPAGLLLDASMLLTGGGTAVAKIPGTIGKIGEIAATTGRVIDPLRPVGEAAKFVGKNVVEPAISQTIGFTTGQGAEPVRIAAKSGLEGETAFIDNLRGKVPVENIVDLAQSALDQKHAAKVAEYKQGMARLNLGGPKMLDYAPIDQALADAEANIAKYKGAVKDEEAIKTLDAIKSKVAEWKAQPPEVVNTPQGTYLNFAHYTAEGFDALKQAIGDILVKTEPKTRENLISSNIYNEIKNQIIKQDPRYGEIMENYATKSDEIKNIQKTFSTDGNTDTAIRKLQSVMRNNANTNYGYRGQLIKELAQYEPSLPAAIAGQSMSTVMPRGLDKFVLKNTLGQLAVPAAGAAAGAHLGAVGALQALPLLALSSPRLMGEAAYKAGQAGRYLQQTPIGPLSRGALMAPTTRGETDASGIPTLTIHGRRTKPNP